MDGLSVAASIIAVIQISEEVITRAVKYGLAVKHSAAELRGETEKLKEILSILEELGRFASYAERSGQPLTQWPTLVTLNARNGPLERCKSALKELEVLLALVTGWEHPADRLTWPQKRDKVRKQVKLIESQKAALLDALAVEHAHQAFGTGQHVTTLATDQARSSILDWLRAPDISTNHTSAINKYDSETGKWLLNCAEFYAWKLGTHKPIWLHGESGCGKTILCSAMVESVKDWIRSRNNHFLLYYYFDVRESAKQNFSNFLRSILSQISHVASDIPPGLDRLRKRYLTGDAPEEAFIQTFKLIIPETERIYLIIDALDECSEIDKVFNFLHGIQVPESNKLNLLIISQYQLAIDTGFKRIQMTIKIPENKVNGDIARVISNSLKENGPLKEWSHSPIRDSIQDALMKEQGNSFRLASCRIELLEKCSSEDEIKDELENLPPDISATYRQILLRIKPLKRAQRVHGALQWLAFSFRPLLLEELTESTAITAQKGFKQEARLRDPRKITDLCSSLIKTSTDLASRTVTIGLAHPSVKRYLLSLDNPTHEDSAFAISEEKAHSYISASCLSYLLYFNDAEPISLQTLEDYPLLRYAARYWMYHIKCVPESSRTPLLHSLLKLEPSASYYNWLRIHDPNIPQQQARLWKKVHEFPQPLYYASLLGFHQVAERLINEGAEIEAKTDSGKTALYIAAQKRHKDIVAALLKHGADPNTSDSAGRTPLLMSAQNADTSVMKLLLEKGADIDRGAEYGLSSLHIAAKEGYLAGVNVLLDQGANVNKTDNFGFSALDLAAERGHAEIVQLLLQHGGDHNGASLILAIEEGRAEEVELLLNAGASANAQNSDGQSALAIAIRERRLDTAKALLKKGADPDVLFDEDTPILVSAAANGQVDIVKALLEHGANAEAGTVDTHKSDDGSKLTALFLAAWAGHLEVVELLLERGAKTEVADGDGNTALLKAASAGQAAVVELLLAHGANRDAVNKKGQNMVALQTGDLP